LDIYKNILQERTTSLNDLTHTQDNLQLKIGGLITSIREISTKNGQKMAFAKLEDFFDDVELIIFPQVFTKYKKILSRDRIYMLLERSLINQRTEINPSEPKFLANSFEDDI